MSWSAGTVEGGGTRALAMEVGGAEAMEGRVAEARVAAAAERVVAGRRSIED